MINAEDIGFSAAMLSGKGLYSETDSKEFWDKTSLFKLQKEIFSNTEFSFYYTVNKLFALMKPENIYWQL